MYEDWIINKIQEQEKHRQYDRAYMPVVPFQPPVDEMEQQDEEKQNKDKSNRGVMIIERD